MQESLLQVLRREKKPILPKILRQFTALDIQEEQVELKSSKIKQLFPLTANQKRVRFIVDKETAHKKKRVGIFFSGGQAAGGHNVVIGVFDALKKLNQKSQLFGFLGGPDGLLKNEWIELKENILNHYLNQGGFDLLGSSRTKFESIEQFEKIADTVKDLNLDGLVVIGGDDSNTNAAFLAEYFAQEKIKTKVVGVPKTIDGDLKNDLIEISFGFDTACKTYAEIVSSISRDALSAKKYYFFIKLMGRSASHVTLECALQVHPNMVLISEEIKKKQKSAQDIVNDITDMIVERAAQGKDYGVILIPEGLLESVEEIGCLILELNAILKGEKLEILEMETMECKEDKKVFIRSLLSSNSKGCFDSLTEEVQLQLIQIRDPHGNVQLSKIATEQFLIDLIKKELIKRKKAGHYKGSFNPQAIFCGYEGRCCFPSLFDSRYCYSLGHTAALLIDKEITGCMAIVQKLAQNVDDWQVAGVPLVSFMHMEERGGVTKALIQKTFVELNSPLFKLFEKQRDNWLLLDDYRYVGPIQFFGPQELTDQITLTVKMSEP